MGRRLARTASAVVVATVTAGVFDVDGSHTYAKPGVYTVTINVIDDGGSKTTSPAATFTITDLAGHRCDQELHRGRGPEHRLFVLATFKTPTRWRPWPTSTPRSLSAAGATPRRLSAGIRLAVQQIGVTPLTARQSGDPIFEVLGSHTYAEETPAGLPYTLSVIITTLGGATTTLTSPPGGGVTVLDAPLSSSNGTDDHRHRGEHAPAPSLLGTFTDANQAATVADFTTAPGSVVVNWGDGSAPETLAAANLTAVGLARRRDLHRLGGSHLRRGRDLRLHRHGHR